MTTSELSPSTPSPNDKIMAAIAHVCVIIPLMGIIAPIIIWVTQKDKSQYVAFQAIQAVVYQLCLIILYFVGWGCYFIVFLGIFIPVMATSSNSSGPVPAEPVMVGMMLIPFILIAVFLLAGLVFMIYGIVAAVMTLQGKDFRYAILGKRLERYLKPGAG